MAAAKVYLRLNESSSDTAEVDGNTITFKSVLDNGARTFDLDRIVDERALRPELLEMLVGPMCDDLALGIESTVLLYGQDRALADTTVFRHLVPAISGVLRDSTALVSVSMLEGDAQVPVETLEDVLVLRSESPCNRCLRITARSIDVLNDTVVTGQINIITLDNNSGVDICARQHRGNTLSQQFLQQSLTSNAHLYLFLHCLITPINQSEVLDILAEASDFKAEWQGGSTRYNVSPLNMGEKVQSAQQSHKCLQEFYAGELGQLEDEVLQYKRVNNSLDDSSDEKMALKLQLSQEVNAKMEEQIANLTHLLGDAENNDILTAYMDKAVAYHMLLDETVAVTAQNETLKVTEQADARREALLTSNCKQMNQLLKRQSEQLLKLQQQNVDLKIKMKEVTDLNKSLDAQVLESTSAVVSPSSVFSSTHSHKDSVSSTASSVASAVTSDMESSAAHSKLSHSSLSLKPGFQLNVLKTK